MNIGKYNEPGAARCCSGIDFVKSHIIGSVGELSFVGWAIWDLFDSFLIVYIGTEVGATVSAFGRQLGDTVCGVELSAEGIVVVGCGIKSNTASSLSVYRFAPSTEWSRY